jgi:hypothetical protein
MGSAIFRKFDYQKECPDSEIFDAGSISAPLVGEGSIDAAIQHE